MTTIKNHYPLTHIDPSEPNLVAGYNCRVERGAIRNYGSTGATNDLARSGLPLVGQGHGVRAVDSASCGWKTGASPVAVTAATSAYVVEAEIDANPSATRYLLVNGSVDGYETRVEATGEIQISFDRATMTSTAAGFAAGKGPMRIAGLYDGTNQYLLINGRTVSSDTVAADTPDGYFAIGEHGTIRSARVYGAIRWQADEMVAYARDFARKVLWQWTPHREIPSIATGTTGGDDEWSCPLGAATMGIVWRPDLTDPRGGRFALTDSQNAALNRIEFPFRRPWFGSWLIEYESRDPATDSAVIGFTPSRGVDPTAAGSGSYWANLYQHAGPWWRTAVFYANGAQIDGADCPFGTPVAGDRCAALITRAVDGTIQTYSRTPGGWWWTSASAVDVSALSEGYIVLAPRGIYIERVTYFQGAATPHELGL